MRGLNYLRKAGLLATLAALAMTAGAGCSRFQPELPLLVGDEGEAQMFKRREQEAAVDYFHHFKRTVYVKAEEPLRATAPEQGVLLEKAGAPDYVRRKPFKSVQAQTVEERHYLHPPRVVQFVDGQMVFEGPLTDYEQILLRRGYPDRNELLTDEMGGIVDVLIYRKSNPPRGSRMSVFYLVNGTVIQGSEGI